MKIVAQCGDSLVLVLQDDGKAFVADMARHERLAPGELAFPARGWEDRDDVRTPRLARMPHSATEATCAQSALSH